MPGSAAVGEAQLHIVEDHQGRQMTLGPTQAVWVLEQGLVERSSYERTGPSTAICRYTALDGRTVETLNEMVMAEPSNRECDFCRAIPAGWVVNVRPFRITKGPTPAPFTRPVFACDVCEPLVRSNDKSGLIDRAIDSTIKHAAQQGGGVAAHVASMDPADVRKALSPVVREFVTLVFANRRGFPEQA